LKDVSCLLYLASINVFKLLLNKTDKQLEKEKVKENSIKT